MSNRLWTLCLALLAFFAGAIGVYLMYQRLDFDEYYKLKYIAESEILELEKARVASLDPNNRALFFGNIEKAITLTAKIAKGKSNKRTKVIYSLMPVFGKGIESISSQVHGEIISQMLRERRN